MASAIRAVRLSSLAALLLLSACPYGFTGNLPGHISSVRVAPFRSSASEYGLEQTLTSYFIERLVSQSGLTVVNSSPDALVECRVTGFYRTPYSFSSSEVVEEYKLEIRMELDFTDMVRDEGILDGEAVSLWIVYDPAREDYSAAKERLLADAADEMVRRCISGW